MATPRSLKAVVIGGSGAIGRCLLGELASSPTFSEVVSLGRRKIEIPDRYEIDVAKLKQEIVDFDLEKFTIENSKSYFEEKDVFFCTIGTTRSAASQQPGSTAENFRQIDLHLVTHCAQIAKSAGVRHVSLVTSQGANANSWFLYMRTKGEVENSVEKLDFDRLTVWRPGLLGRGSEARFVEKLAKIFMKAMPVEEVALAMRKEAEKWAFGGNELPKVVKYNNRAIWDFCHDTATSVASQTTSPPPMNTQQEQGDEGERQAVEEQTNEQGGEVQTCEQVADVRQEPDEEPLTAESINGKGEPDDESKDRQEPKSEEVST